MSGYNLVEGLNWVVGDVARRLYYSTTTVPSDSVQGAPSASLSATGVY